MPELRNPSVEFLDAPCSIDRYNKRWCVIRVLNFGIFAFQEREGEPTILRSVYSLEAFEHGNRLEIVSHSEGVYAVRNICGSNCKVEDNVSTRIPYWVNVVTPNSEMVNLSKVRVEAYNTKEAALKDAKQEIADGYVVYTVEQSTVIGKTNLSFT